MTNFCPYKAGIIGIIEQYLVPPVIGDLNDEEASGAEASKRLTLIPPRVAGSHRAGLKSLSAPGNNGPVDKHRLMTSRGIRAELYKLNVYSGPSGHFKPHVDTPRSEMQIGSLVVCLPVQFSGGALSVRHHDREIVYKWGQCEPAIRWAAFYSDCEHEVHEVTSGHRITLTYNLYLASGTGLLTAPACDKTWLRKGGYLGVHLAHTYPHTHGVQHAFVPNMLKGSDMAVYEAVTSLGLVSVLDALSVPNMLPSEGMIAKLEKMYEKYRKAEGSEKPPLFSYRLREVCTNDIMLGDSHRLSEYDDEFNEDLMREIKNAREHAQSEDEYLSEDELYGENCELLFVSSDDDDEMHLQSEVAELFKPAKDRDRITWVNQPGNKELSEAFIAYGNQAELRVGYSTAALIVKIPKWSARRAYGESGEKNMEMGSVQPQTC